MRKPLFSWEVILTWLSSITIPLIKYSRVEDVAHFEVELMSLLTPAVGLAPLLVQRSNLARSRVRVLVWGVKKPIVSTTSPLALLRSGAMTMRKLRWCFFPVGKSLIFNILRDYNKK